MISRAAGYDHARSIANMRETELEAAKANRNHIDLKVVWDHVHQCGACGHAIRIDQIDLKIIAAGVITCPKCEFSGPVNVKIIDEKMIPAPSSSSHRNGQ
jgi:hypothetical protein